MAASSSSRLVALVAGSNARPSLTAWLTTPLTASPMLLASPFHSSAPANESRKKRLTRMKKKQNLERRRRVAASLEITKPDPVLGYGSRNEGLWTESKLKSVLLDKEHVWRLQNPSPSSSSSPSADAAGGPELVNFGLTAEDRELLFKRLPAINIETRVKQAGGRLPGSESEGTSSSTSTTSSASSSSSSHLTPSIYDGDAVDAEIKAIQDEQYGNAELLGRIVDLRNASSKGIAVENKRRIIDAFGRQRAEEEAADAEARVVDTGSPEVQAAILTYRIHNLHSHLTNARHDHHNRRALRHLVHKRAKILRYLKRKSVERYDTVLGQLGLEKRAVEGEVVVP